ncbi:MAG: hypothetical protein IPK64_14675 [bacterium]|nr:hypothetical protein [bacterium]
MAAADQKANNGFNAPAVVLSALAGLIFVVALSLFLQGGFLAAQALETKQKTETPVNEPLRAHLAEHEARLQEAPRWLDEQKTKAVMPIDAAMDRLASRRPVQPLPAAPMAEAPAGSEVRH